MNERGSHNPNLPQVPQSVRLYIKAWDLPAWEQLSLKSQQELVQTLASLLADLPQQRASQGTSANGLQNGQDQLLISPPGNHPPSHRRVDTMIAIASQTILPCPLTRISSPCT